MKFVTYLEKVSRIYYNFSWMQAATDKKQNPFLSYHKVSTAETLSSADGSAFVATSPQTFNEKIDPTLAQLFLTPDLYNSNTFANGTYYKSFCFHGPLGTFAFDGISKRIIEKEDDFKKALVLSNSYDDSKKLAKRLLVQSFDKCSTESKHSIPIIDRVRTATSIQNAADAYKPLGADPHEDQILFYDQSQLLYNIGSRLKNLKEQLSKEQEEGSKIVIEDLEPYKSQKKEIVSSLVANFVKEQNLVGTNQIYINSAEKATTDLAYDVLQELSAQLKDANGQEELRIGAVANFDYHREDGTSLTSMFGKPIYLKPRKAYQQKARIPQETNSSIRRSLTDPKKYLSTRPQHIIKVTKSAPFASSLANQIASRIEEGDQRVFVRAQNKDSTAKLTEKLALIEPKLSYGWVADNQMGYVDAKGAQHLVENKAEFLALWGAGFNTLVHSGQFDQLEEPADAVFTALKILNADDLEKMATPLFTLRSDAKEANNLVFYNFGSLENLVKPEDLIKEIQFRHQTKGRVTRGIKSGSASFDTRAIASFEAEVTDADAAYEQEWLRRPTAFKHFWTNVFGSTDKLKSYVTSYVLQQAKTEGLDLDRRAIEREKQYVWKLINLTSIINHSPNLTHDKRKVFQFLFDKAGKNINEYIGRYSSILGIDSQSDAQARARHVYKSVYRDVNKSKDPIIPSMDFLAGDNLNYNERIHHRAGLIGQFLFKEDHIDLLTQQNSIEGKTDFEDSKLENTILVLTGALETKDESLLDIKVKFDRFITELKSQKIESKSITSLGISLETAKELVEEYLCTYEEEFVDKASTELLQKREDSLVASLRDAAPLQGARAGETDQFYRFIASHADAPGLEVILKVNSDLIQIKNFTEAASVISNLGKAESYGNSAVISNWKEKFAAEPLSHELVASYVLAKLPDLLKKENHHGLRSLVDLLSGQKRLAPAIEQDIFKDFIASAYDEVPSSMSRVVSHGKKDTLTKAQVFSSITRSNPGLMGIASKEDLVSVIKKICKEDMTLVIKEALKNMKDKSKADELKKTKFNNYSDLDYQTMVVEFARESSLASLASRIGLNVKELSEMYLPGGPRPRLENAFKVLAQEAKANGQNLSNLKETWEDVWQCDKYIDGIVHSMMIADTFDKECDPDFNFGLNTRTVSRGDKGFFVFSADGLSYGEYIKPALNVKKLNENPMEHLTLKWTGYSNLDGSEQSFHDRSDMWGDFLNEGLEQNIETEIADSKKALRTKKMTLSLESKVHPRFDNTGLSLPEVVTEQEAKKHFYAVTESFMKALDISEPELLDLFHSFITSNYFKNQNLQARFPLPGAISRFLGSLSGFITPDSSALLAKFVSYLGNRDDLDNRAFSSILKELVSRQGNYFAGLKQNQSGLKAIAASGGHSAMSAVDRVEEFTGLELPVYPKLKIEAMRTILNTKLDGLVDMQKATLEDILSDNSNVEYAAAIDKHWDIIASEFFCVNFFDLDYNPQLIFPIEGDQSKQYVFEILDPKSSSPKVNFRLEAV